MDLKSKRRKEIEEQKEKRKKEIIEAALKTFVEKGIDNTKMTDIAEKAQFGVATVYRYFKTKPELVIITVANLCKQELDFLYDYYNDIYTQELCGADELRRVLNVFLNMYKNHPEFIGLLEDFDNYIVKENISVDMLDDYEKRIISMKNIIFEAIEKGQKDGSIRENIDYNRFYFTITHSLMSLCQKLILRGMILKSDSEIDGEKQIEMLIDMAISYIAK